MARRKGEDHMLSRRAFLRGMGMAPMLLVPAPFQGVASHAPVTRNGSSASSLPVDLRLTPHYPSKSALDDVLRLVVPGTDEYVTERYAFEIMPLLREWAQALKTAPPAVARSEEILNA